MSHKGSSRSQGGVTTQGFTLVEMLVVVAILAVVGTLAFPSFMGTVARYRVMRASEDMMASLYLARTEAIRQGSARIVIERDKPANCAGSTAKGRWDCGWLIYRDNNDNGTLDPDELLHQAAPFEGVEIRHSNSQDRLRFNRWGDFSALGFGFVAAAGGATAERAICAQGAGRLRASEGSATC